MNHTPSMVALSLRGVVGLALMALIAGASHRSEACALAGGSTIQVRIDAEEALIVWDGAHHRQHFIRRADFHNAGRRPFGFLVPTPARPEIAEADEGVFARLAGIYSRPTPRYHGGHSRSAGGGGESSVEVVEVTRVAGLDATVLRATDANALAEWLRARGFSSRPGLATWLARYTSGAWHVTAFRYDGGARAAFGSRAVRLSFDAARPFYPYAEPTDQSQESRRRLRLTVVSDARVRGVVGDAPWAARTGYAGQPSLAAVLRGAVPDGAVAAGAWMTTFEERPSRRGERDLFFEAAPEQTPVRPSLERYTRVRVVRWNSEERDSLGELGL